jgi:hypothetical protein
VGTSSPARTLQSVTFPKPFGAALWKALFTPVLPFTRIHSVLIAAARYTSWQGTSPCLPQAVPFSRPPAHNAARANVQRPHFPRERAQ